MEILSKDVSDSQTTVTVNKGQGQNIKFSGLNRQTKFERNWFVNVLLQVNLDFFSHLFF